ncbi:MAG TPA: tetraacyldisaccharide 4'-kinase [Burkholderiaceae bacterium]|nr:tetraacyldisaccharide 4'-kinase [Burkholderiaceae bacterium]
MNGWATRLLASWQRPRPDALARALQPLSWLYRALSGAQRTLYRSGLRPSQRAPRPLIVVGNLLAGGVGKTPTVIAVVELLRALGYNPGVVSRGYGRRDDATCIVDPSSQAGQVGDEPLLIHLRTRAPVAVAARRIDAARALCQAHPDVDVLVADDGLQHLALARDVQLILFDERGVGNGLLLPAGPLRAPLPREVPERTLVLYNAPQPSTMLPGYVIERSLPGVVMLPRWWRGERGDAESWQALRGRRVVACAGTAVPQRFFAMLQARGLAFDALALPDHADYAELPWASDAADVVLTEKDAVKIHPERVGRTQVWVVPLDFHLDDAVAQMLKRWLPPPA